jgi:hypothetical protein
MAKGVVCEVLNAKGWRSIGVDDYLTLRETGGRCLECKEPIRAHKRSVNGMAAHFEHRRRNPKCSLSDGRSLS